MSEKEVNTIIKIYIALLKASGISIERVFLYGSYARGEATDSSDIDLMIISDSNNTGNPEFKALMWELARKADTRIEPYIVSTKRFISDDVSPLLQIVKKEGKEIYT
jgi:predicted nucleotidyltransferase